MCEIGPLLIHHLRLTKQVYNRPLVATFLKAILTLLVLTFLVHSGIEGGHNVPPDIETPVKPQVFVQIKSNKNRKVE